MFAGRFHIHILKSFLAPVVLYWCFFYLEGCKEPGIENKDLLTGDDVLNLKKDTLCTAVFSEWVKPLNSQGVTTTVIGDLTDSKFGRTHAGFYAQCRLLTNNVTFGENPVLDSVVLTLKYNNKYGRFDRPADVSVFELNASLLDSVTYKTTDAFAVKIPAIGQLTNFTPNLIDSIQTVTGKLPAHLRITLSPSFGNKILLANAADLQDNNAFLNLFKGFYITANAPGGGNGLIYFDPRSPLSKITLYYKNNSADSLFYDIPLAGVRFNHFDNIYDGTPVYQSVTSPNPAGEERMYLQSGAGVRGKITITELDSLPQNIAINKAELVLSQSPSDTEYASPLLLDLFRIDDAGQNQVLEDDASSSFGGTRIVENIEGVNVVRYRFNIRRYLQKLVQGIYRNNGFYVQTLSGETTSERLVIANSCTDKKYNVTLIVTYTKL